MESRVIKSRKRHSGIQGPMLKKVLKTMPHSKENIPELPLNNSITTNEMENETTIEDKVKVVRFKQPTQKYTKEALLELQNLSSSKVRPKFLDNFPDLDLELAGKTRKGSRPVASGKPATNTKTVAFDLPPWQNQLTENGEPKTEKKPQDAKDRLKKDQDIVLSPQRRSFNSGCFVTMNASSGPKRSNSPLNTSAKQYVEREPIREPRRVGSGRLMSRDSWDSGFRQPENGIANNYNFGKGGFRESSSHSSIEPRRKDFEFDRGETDRYRNYDRFKGSSNYDRRRNDSYRTQEEPEWMTDGPTSQHDTIELRGFEDPPVDKTKKKKTKPASRAKKNSIESTSTESVAAIKGASETKIKKTKKEKDEDKKKRSTVDKPNNESEDQTKKDSESITGNEFIQAYDAEHKINDNVFNDFNIDDFLKPDYLSDMHIEGETDGNVAGSRFRQWFTTHDSSRASSASTEMLNSAINKGATDNVEEDPRQLTSMLMGMVKHNNQNESKNITNAYDSITSSENNKLPPAIMDVIKASAPQLTDPKAAIRDLEVNGKVQSLEEIESRLRMSSGQQNGYSPPLNNIQFHEEMKLKKLHNMKMPQNEHENSNNDGHITNSSQNYSILQMLNNAQGPQNYMVNQGQNPAGQYGSSNNYRSQQPSMQVPNDLVMKLMEAQQIQKQHENMVAKAMAAQQQQSKQNMFKLPVELQNMVNFYTPTKDILQSREAQEMLMGIKRGEVMLHHLVEQWKKTSTNQSRYRETLICLMKVFQHSSNAQRMANQQDLVYQQQQQAALYQSQMLKRQLLDQTHKRMENVHNASYGGEGAMDLGSSQSQSQPRIGLTPTSVLRKMTSTSEPLVDKHHIPDERSVTQHALQHQINTLQQQIQQQQFMQQQQQQQQQQQRPVNTTIQQILSGNYPRYHGAQQQQQQHQSNNMNGRSINYGSADKSRMNRVQSPVSNQLARWFSPELLAQARAGRLPNMPAMSQNINMLSVEDIEKFQVGGRS
ncbi:eukaryotic translation initiation factor 4E transporter isoform X2 [Acyrthosiphon pisum]|uniref:Eukaryotic translation initiation factor 4E transporter n=1 Tax=Acyrthosiphon pisum TaxID=7029 RepID=A0A8R2H6H1_ACYPI|nr:eukaryotic translation initiation factor 4E transporter isoform X2 [Acyrthosiphon pisum]|eukprot:XP_016659667.1 PREDICTED: eukaryotic translation initiation factor 4E transporter isoform X2 [Acyrthosiphon pisum]